MAKLVRALALAGAAVALTGCGTIHPGEAAVVGDTEIGRDQVNAVATDICTLTVQQGAAQGQQVRLPISVWRTQVLEQTVVVELQRQFGDSRKVTPDRAEVNRQLADPQLAVLDNPEVAALRDSIEGRLEGASVLTQVGRQLLGQKAPVDQANNAGQQEFATWLEEAAPEVVTDPRYNAGDLGQIGGGDGSVSRPFSNFAKVVADADPAISQELPDGQLCLSPKS